MSVKPTTFPVWDTSNTVSTPPTAGHMLSGWTSGEIPTHSELSGWQQLVGNWFLWLYSTVAIVNRSRSFLPWAQTASAFTAPTPFNAAPLGLGFASNDIIFASTSAATVGFAYLDVDCPAGYKLTAISFTVSVNNLSIGPQLYIYQSSPTSADPTLGALALNDAVSYNATVINTPQVISFNLNPVMTAGTSITVSTSGGNTTYTRASGSWITDGWNVGYKVSWTGFINGANNVSTARVISLTATAMTIVNTGVVETSAGATPNPYCPTQTGATPLWFVIGFGKSAGQLIGWKNLQTTCTPQ